MKTGTWRERLARDRALGALWRALSFALLFLAILGVEFLLIPATVESDADQVSAGLVVQGGMLLAAALLAGWVMLRWVDHRPFADLGFGLRPRIVREIPVGLAIGVISLASAVAGLTLAGAFDYRPEPGSVIGWLAVVGGSLAWLAIPAAAEEALFRGYVLRVLAEGTGPVAALVTTSLLFALVHGNNPNIAPIGLANIFLAGVLLGVAVLRTGSLWFATAIHLGWNWAIAGLLDLPVSGLRPFDPPLYDAAPVGPAWLTGGAFGPEGGLAATMAVGIGLALTWWLTRPGQALAGALETKGTDRVDR